MSANFGLLLVNCKADAVRLRGSHAHVGNCLGGNECLLSLGVRKDQGSLLA